MLRVFFIRMAYNHYNPFWAIMVGLVIDPLKDFWLRSAHDARDYGVSIHAKILSKCQIWSVI